MMFATFKLIGGLMCVFANSMVMLTDSNIENVVKDFIAVGIIAKIDDLMAGTTLGNEELQKIASTKVYQSIVQAQKSDA